MHCLQHLHFSLSQAAHFETLDILDEKAMFPISSQVTLRVIFLIEGSLQLV
jgi:hypothetical protein